MFQATDNLLGYLCGVELHGVVASADKGGTHEAGADVVDADVTQAADVAELRETLQIMVHEALGGRVGGGGTEAFRAGDAHGQIEIFDELKKFVTTDYSQYAKVIVWHGWSAYDQLLLFLMSVLVKGTLYHVDLRDCKGFMEKYLSKDPSRAYPDFGYVSAYDIYTYNMISLAKPLNDDDKKYYSRQWFKWANSKAPYRFSDIHTGVIEEYPENFMDDSIKEYAQKYSSFIMVILNVLRKYDDLFISDNIVKRRIYQLRDYGIIKLFVSLNEEK